MPGNPARILAGTKANKETVKQIEKEIRTNIPVLKEHWSFIKKSFSLNFGNSFIHKKPVKTIILQFLPNTLYLAISSIMISIIISLFLGIISATKPSSKYDLWVTFYTSAFLTIPNFLLSLLLILFFSVFLKILPISGSSSLKHIILPTLCLSLAMSAHLTKIFRASFKTELKKPYVLFARAKGLSNKKIIFKHILRNAMLPVITTIGLQFSALISGVIIIETIFSWQGIGILLINSIKLRDYPLIQGLVLFIVLVYLIVNLIVDVLYYIIDPRLKIREKELE